MTSTAATGRRASKGIAPQMPAVFGPVEWLTRTSIHSAQSDGLVANDTATIAAVAPSTIARLRHSRRTANHSTPTPGVTFVSSTNAHVAGHRKPTTLSIALHARRLAGESSQ